MFMAPIINTFSIAIEVIKIQVLSYSVTKLHLYFTGKEVE